MQLTRRGFIGAAIASAPAMLSLGGFARWLNIDSEYLVKFHGFPDVSITTMKDGAIEATFGGQKMASVDSGGWKVIYGDIENKFAQLRVRVPERKRLDIDWVKMSEPECVYFDHFTHTPIEMDFGDFPIPASEGHDSVLRMIA